MSVDVDQVPIEQAAEELAFPAEILAHLVRCEVIAGYTPAATGVEGYCDLEAAAQLAGQLAAARAPVEGHGILATDAAEKYGFAAETIYRWQEAGWITLVTNRERNRLFNEADIVFARELANLVGHVPGKAIFPAKPRSGRPRKA